jgi:uncharacterized damage-inducible protein DinB
MGKLELIRAMYDYNEWANNHVLQTAAQVSEDDFVRPQGASFDSVEGNLAHIVGAQIVWLARWAAGNNPPLGQVQNIKGMGAIRQAFDRSHDELRAYLRGLTEETLDAPMTFTDSRGTQHRRVPWQLLMHVANHGTHHRAETAMALTAMGHPPRQLDYSFFQVERDGA